MKKEHSLRRRNDQFFCEECGRQWDFDDADRENTVCERENTVGRDAIREMRKKIAKATLQSDK